MDITKPLDLMIYNEVTIIHKYFSLDFEKLR
jgi:hypothetical protein